VDNHGIFGGRLARFIDLTFPVLWPMRVVGLPSDFQFCPFRIAKIAYCLLPLEFGRIPCGVATLRASAFASVLRTLPYGQPLRSACAGNYPAEGGHRFGYAVFNALESISKKGWVSSYPAATSSVITQTQHLMRTPMPQHGKANLPDCKIF
jgi:hypothetical protein